MTTGTKNARVIIGILSWVPILILSCDSFTEDLILAGKQVNRNENVFYIFPGSSVVIDLKAIVKQSHTDAQLSTRRIRCVVRNAGIHIYYNINRDKK